MSGLPAPLLLQPLLAAWHDSSHQKPRLLLLEGAAGIGKSHNLRAFADSGQNALVLSTACTGWLSTALRAFHVRLESERDPSFLQAARSLSPDVSWAQVAHAPALNDQNALWTALAQAFERLARRCGGLILLLEDAHDASADDLGALRVLYRRALLGKAPILIALSARPSTELTAQDLLEGFRQDAAIADGPSPERLSLSNLDQNGVIALLHQHLHSEFLPDDLAAWLHTRAEGHPLHTLELLRFLRDGGALQDLGVSWIFSPPKGKGIPKTLEAILTARVANARRQPKTWLALAALCMLEREVTLSEWATLCDQDENTLLEIAHRLEYQGLLRETLIAGQTAYEVAHPLYSPQVRAQLEPDELVRLHRLGLQVSTSNHERARHARACDHERAIEFSRLALEESKTRFAHSQILEHARYLLRHEISDRLEVRWALAGALKDLGHFEEVLTLLEGDDSGKAIEDRLSVLDSLGRTDAAFTVCEQGFATASEPHRTRIGTSLARLCINRNDLQRAETILDSLEPSDDGDTAAVLTERWRLSYFRNEPQMALGFLERAEPLARKAGLQRLLLMILITTSDALSFLGRHAEAQVTRDQGLLIAREIGAISRMVKVYHSVGFAFVCTGEYPKARVPFARVLRLAQSIKDQRMIAEAYKFASVLDYGSGNLERARDLNTRAIEHYVAIGEQVMVKNVMFFHAWAESLYGNAVAVHAFLESNAAREPESLYGWHQQASQLFLNIGEYDRAREVLRDAPLETYQPDALAEHETVLAILALIDGDSDLALEHIDSAITHLEAGGSQSTHAQLRFTRAIIHHKRQHLPQAQTEAAEALEVLERNQALGLIVPLERMFPHESQALRTIKAAPAFVADSSFLRTLGSFSLERDGQTTVLRDSKARDLLSHLLVALLREDGPGISRTQLIDAIWPESADTEALEVNFRVTLKRLREKLGDAASVLSRDGIYELRDLNADVTQFLRALERLDFEAALGWYKGEFLPNIEVADVEIVRAQLWQRFRDTALRSSLEQPAAVAADLLEKLHRLEPLDVTLLERLTSTLRGVNDPFRLEQTLSRARTIFERETGEIPIELLLLERA